MSICPFNPDPQNDEHKFVQGPARVECEFCHVGRDDQPCFCLATTEGHIRAHTVGNHDKNSCGGFLSYRGPCGSCYDCISDRIAYLEG